MKRVKLTEQRINELLKRYVTGADLRVGLGAGAKPWGGVGLKVGAKRVPRAKGPGGPGGALL